MLHLTIIDGLLNLSLIKREIKMKKILTILSLLVTLSIAAIAQPGWNWPEQEKPEAEEKNVHMLMRLKWEILKEQFHP